MTDPHARTALKHPTWLAFETLHPRFRWHDREVSYVLTVNAGHE